eukprot:scaffold6943_cov18-Tisochrysis_lutea.AAC.2
MVFKKELQKSYRQGIECTCEYKDDLTPPKTFLRSMHKYMKSLCAGRVENGVSYVANEVLPAPIKGRETQRLMQTQQKIHEGGP